MAANPLYAFGELLLLTGGGLDVTALSANGSLTGASAHFQRVSASGANRNLTLPSVAGTYGFGRWYVIYNTGSTYSVVVKDADGSTTLVTLAPGECALVKAGKVSGTNGWYVALYTGALLAAASVAFTGRLTTTDGVASGDARVVGGNAYTKTSGTQVANTTTETTIGTYTLPANTLKAGTQIRVRGALRVAGVNGTPTITLRLKLGSTTYITSAALNVIADDVVGFDTVITGRAAPAASAAVVAEGVVSATQSGTPAAVQKVVAPANYATNGALAVAATIQWSAAHASNDLTCDSFSVDVVG